MERAELRQGYPHRMSLHMTFEKIHRAPFDCKSVIGSNRCDTCFGPIPEEKPEHPARKAARMIRQLHLDNIDLINSGHIFMREGVDVSAEMKASCEAQIKLCDEIMQRAENMDPSYWSPSLLLCEDVQRMVGMEVAEREKLRAPHAEGEEQEVLGSILPEIGDYGHKQ